MAHFERSYSEHETTADRVLRDEDGLHETRRREPESAVVIKALLREDRQYDDPFGEIVSLCETAGARVVERFAQNVERISAGSYLGRGKIEEIAARIQELDVDLVVADNDLSPGQERNLEKAFKRPVIDRSQLILDIFAQRARSLQAKLQVEMAQLKYTLPRLRRMWGHLSRFEGGIGMRGPGETQLETDKRLIQRRIRILRRKLDDIEARRELALNEGRRDLVISLVGYTNVGKSTLLNVLTHADEFVEDKLFATLDTRTRKWEIDDNRHVLLNDTVGFIRQLPHHLVASFHATLAETQHADLLFHVVDASAPQARRQIVAVLDVLRKIDCAAKPCWLLLNKWDRVADGGEVEARDLVKILPSDTPFFELSAATGHGLEELRAAVAAHLDRLNERVSLLVPHDRGDLIAFIRRNGRVLEQEFVDTGTRLDVEMPAAPLAKLRGLYPEGFAAE